MNGIDTRSMFAWASSKLGLKNASYLISFEIQKSFGQNDFRDSRS